MSSSNDNQEPSAPVSASSMRQESLLNYLSTRKSRSSRLSRMMQPAKQALLQQQQQQQQQQKPTSKSTKSIVETVEKQAVPVHHVYTTPPGSPEPRPVSESFTFAGAGADGSVTMSPRSSSISSPMSLASTASPARSSIVSVESLSQSTPSPYKRKTPNRVSLSRSTDTSPHRKRSRTRGAQRQLFNAADPDDIVSATSTTAATSEPVPTMHSSAGVEAERKLVDDSDGIKSKSVAAPTFIRPTPRRNRVLLAAAAAQAKARRSVPQQLHMSLPLDLSRAQASSSLAASTSSSSTMLSSSSSSASASPRWLKQAEALISGTRSTVPVASRLLPTKYDRLLRMFDGLESTMRMVTGRNRALVTYDDIKYGVCRTSQCKFTDQRLGQILAIFPEGYKVDVVEKRHRSRMKLELHIKWISITHETLHEALSTSSVMGSDSDKEQLSPRMRGGHSLITHSEMQQRHTVFRMRLFDLVHKYHQVFLDTLEDWNVPSRSMTTWHVDFDVERVADIKSILPDISHTVAIHEASQRDAVRRAMQDRIEAKERMVQRVTDDELVQQSAVDSTAVSSVAAAVKEAAFAAGSLQEDDELAGIDPELLKRVRKRTIIKKRLEEVKAAECHVLLQKLAELPYLATLIRTCMLASKRTRIPFRQLTRLLSSRHKSRPAESVLSEYLEMIMKICPGWLTDTTSSSGLRIIIVDMSRPISTITKALHQARKQEAESLEKQLPSAK
jgi:DNA replication factor CDT1 like